MDFIKKFIKSEAYCNKLSNKLNLALGNKQNLFTFCPFIFQLSHVRLWRMKRVSTPKSEFSAHCWQLVSFQIRDRLLLGISLFRKFSLFYYLQIICELGLILHVHLFATDFCLSYCLCGEMLIVC